MSTTNPIAYTSRTFATILADINSDPTLQDKPDWFKRLIAGMGDVASVWENASANQAFLRTAFTRRAVADLAALLDYFPVGLVSSSGYVMFDISPLAAPPFTVAAADLVALAQGTVAFGTQRFESRASLNVTSLTEVTAAASWSTVNSKVTVASVFTTGELVRIASSGTMPSPFAVDTDYYAIYVDATHIRLASSRAAAYAGTYITITAAGTGNHTITRLSRLVLCYQQTSVAQYSAGSSDGVTPWQKVILPHIGIQQATLQVSIGGDAWTLVDTLVNSAPTDKHFRFYANTDGTSTLFFGNGTYGAIPGAFDVLASYAFGGGVASNITAAGRIAAYGGTDSNVIGASNPGTMTGGSDAELISNTKALAPLLLKARDRFVTIEDGQALALAYGGLSLAKVNKNTYGLLSCQVLAIATGGGNPSSGVRTAIQAYLIDLSVLSSIDVHFDAATITSVAVTSAAKMLSGYLWATVEPKFRLAWSLFLTERGAEILAFYEASGISGAVTLINTAFSTTFETADYAWIQRLLDNLVARNFGDRIDESDVFAFIQGSVSGIDYMTVAVPAFPVTLAADEITTVGALTLTEIP
jgi:hypothetical protein